MIIPRKRLIRPSVSCTIAQIQTAQKLFVTSRVRQWRIGLWWTQKLSSSHYQPSNLYINNISTIHNYHLPLILNKEFLYQGKGKDHYLLNKISSHFVGWYFWKSVTGLSGQMNSHGGNLLDTSQTILSQEPMLRQNTQGIWFLYLYIETSFILLKSAST